MMDKFMPAETEADAALAARRKRLIYRAWHRGIREMDLVLGPYAEAHAPKLDNAEIERLEILMEEQDADLLAWVTGQHEPPNDADAPLLAEIMAYHDSQKTR